MLKRIAAAFCLAAITGATLVPSAQAQTTKRLTHQPPAGAGIGFLLTDGTAMFQANNGSDWYKLTPDATGSYQNGTWTQLASLPAGYSPYAFASALLANGRLVIAGGEYNQGVFAFTDLSAVYDPLANTWTNLPPPAGWGFIGDSPSTILPDGRFLLGRKFDKRIAALDPTTLAWTELKNLGKKDFNAEEGWTLLPNGTVLTYDVKAAPNSEIYDSAKQHWSTAGSTVSFLASPPEIKSIKYGKGMVYHPPGEVGPAILRPDGTVFATGGTPKGESFGHTAIYTPGKGWAAGPNFPSGEDAGDSFAALLPSGKVLVESEVGNLYEFDGTILHRTSFNGSAGSLLVLPTGEILVNGSFVYIGTGAPNPSWAPTITNVPASVTRGSDYVIKGTQFNGLSQAEGFGDELETATNYPLVRITNTATGHVFYARTHDHSTMAVATGATPVSTHFQVAAGTETGASSLVVVTNGIASAAVAVTVN